MKLKSKTMGFRLGIFLAATILGSTLFAESNRTPIQKSSAGTTVGKPECCVFPLRERPIQSYLTNPRNFGANRANGRLHSAADLYRPSVGEDVRAVEGGQVIRGPYPFYQGTYAIEVKHDSGFVARYGEITSKRVVGVGFGTLVTRGQTIGYLGKVNSNCCSPMLNFELFAGTAIGPLTQNRKPYQRRSDLINPTPSLQSWERQSFGENYFYQSGEENKVLLPDQSFALLDSYLVPTIRTIRVTKNPSELQSLLELLLTSAINLSGPKEIVLGLESRQFELKSSVEGSESMGSLLNITSTKSSNPNFDQVRLLYFGESSTPTLPLVDKFVLQHFSVEARPGVTLSTLKDNLNFIIGAPTTPEIETNDFVQWRLPKGYVLWIKSADENESENSDGAIEKGSIRIAIELMP